MVDGIWTNIDIKMTITTKLVGMLVTNVVEIDSQTMQYQEILVSLGYFI